MAAVRMCFPRFDEVYRIENNQIVGAAKIFGQLYLGATRGFNASFVFEPSIGVPKDADSEIYDGCIGSLQRNDSDFMATIGLVTFPVKGPNLTQVLVDGSNTMELISGYNRTNASDVTRTQVMDMVFSFSVPLWFLLLFTYVVTFFTLRVALLRHRKKWAKLRSLWHTKQLSESRAAAELVVRKESTSNSWWVTVACILKQNAACGCCLVANAPISITYTTITILSLYAGFYLTSMIKTDMVVVKPPKTIKSYKEFIDSGRRPAFFEITSDRKDFMFAAEGSLERQIWEIAVARGINNSVLRSSYELMMNAMYGVGHGEVVFFSRAGGMAKALIQACCAVMRVRQFHATVNVLKLPDQSAKEQLLGQIRNPLVSRTVAKKVANYYQRMFEANLRETALLRFNDIWSISPVSHEEAKPHFRAIEDCASNVVTIPYPEWMSVPMFHYVSLFAVVSVSLLLAVVVFAAECVKSRSRVAVLQQTVESEHDVSISDPVFDFSFQLL